MKTLTIDYDLYEEEKALNRAYDFARGYVEALEDVSQFILSGKDFDEYIKANRSFSLLDRYDQKKWRDVLMALGKSSDVLAKLD